MGSRVVIWLVSASLLLGALTTGAHADGRREYRWVGQDGHVYVTATPPPNGAGEIEPAASPVSRPVAKENLGLLDAFLGWLGRLWDAFLGWFSAEKPVRQGRRVRTEQDADCSRWGGVIADW